jgi:cell fate regulator YaaT (PSP1 superfamily)
MSVTHWIRVGAEGRLGLFRGVDATIYQRQTRVVVRTDRGLEVGEVLTAGDHQQTGQPTAGTLLRRTAVEDELLLARLNKHRERAFAACEEEVRLRELPVTLLDVEVLLDSQTLLFYFLGESTPQLEATLKQLADRYEAKAQLRKFAEAVEHGCGPGCGTEAAQGSGGCQSCQSGCAVSSCGIKAARN